MTQTALERGGFLQLLEQISNDVASRIPAKSSAASRRKAHQEMLATFDLDRLVELDKVVKNIINVMVDNPVDLENLGPIDDARATSLMAEILDETTVKELLEARREMIRAAVFAHITEVHRAAGVVDPENTNGSLEVPALAKKFTREGCGRTAPRLDEDKFRELLGKDSEKVYRAEIVPEYVIPEHIEYSLDTDRVLDLARSDPRMLGILEQCLIPGDYRSPRFLVRDM